MIEYTEDEITTRRHEVLNRILDEAGMMLEDLERQYQNLFGGREVQYTAYMIQGNINRYLLGHPVVVLDREAYLLAHAAATALFNLHQRISALEESFRSVKEEESVGKGGE